MGVVHFQGVVVRKAHRILVLRDTAELRVRKKQLSLRNGWVTKTAATLGNGVKERVRNQGRQRIAHGEVLRIQLISVEPRGNHMGTMVANVSNVDYVVGRRGELESIRPLLDVSCFPVRRDCAGAKPHIGQSAKRVPGLRNQS